MVMALMYSSLNENKVQFFFFPFPFYFITIIIIIIIVIITIIIIIICSSCFQPRQTYHYRFLAFFGSSH